MFNRELENQVDRIVAQINKCRDFDDLDTVADNYEEIAHPHIGYSFGESYLIFAQKTSAFKYLVHSASHGLEKTNPWINTGYANSIGHSYYYLVTKYNYDKDLDSVVYKMFANAYMFLSVCIYNMGDNAFDSNRARGKLFDYNHFVGDKVIRDYYHHGDILCREILSLGDFVSASIGLSNNGFQHDAQDCRSWAEENFSVLKELPQYAIANMMGLELFSHISKENSILFLNNLLKAYQKGTFYINPNEWRKVQNSQNRKSEI